MSYRPYPNADRALRQLARHTPPEPPTIPALAPLGEAIAQARASARKILEDRFTPNPRNMIVADSPLGAINRSRGDGFAAGFRAGYASGGGHPHRA